MTTDELYAELEKRGHFVVLTFCPEDLIDSYDGENPPSEEEARRVCAYVARRFSDGDDFAAMIEWAQVIIREDRARKRDADK